MARRRSFHPAAELLPLLSDAELQQLADDIRANGQLEPILLDNDGRILDGRNRYLACEIAGVEPRFETWDGRGSAIEAILSKQGAERLVRSLNVLRRHLTAEQRAGLAVKFDLARAKREARERQGTRTDLPDIRQKSAGSENGKATEQAGRAWGVNRDAVRQAARVQEKAPELLDEVIGGKRRLGDALRHVKRVERAERFEQQDPGEIEADSAIVLGDCLDVTWPDAVDLVIADPPFGLSSAGASGVREGKGEWDERDYGALHAFNGAWLTRAFRALRDGGSLFVFGSLHNIWSLGHELRGWGVYLVRDIVWEKPFTQSAPNPNALVPSHELILWARKGSRHTCNLSEITRDVWRDIAPHQRFKHPAEKPEKLIERLINIASNPGDLVADPFLGSGTTTATAKRLRRRYWGAEKDDYWWRVASERTREA